MAKNIDVQATVTLDAARGNAYLWLQGQNVDSPLPPVVSYVIRPTTVQGHALPEMKGNSANNPMPAVHNLGSPSILMGGKLVLRVAVVDFDQIENKYRLVVRLLQDGNPDNPGRWKVYEDVQEFAYQDPQLVVWSLDLA